MEKQNNRPNPYLLLSTVAGSFLIFKYLDGWNAAIALGALLVIVFVLDMYDRG